MRAEADPGHRIGYSDPEFSADELRRVASRSEPVSLQTQREVLQRGCCWYQYRLFEL